MEFIFLCCKVVAMENEIYMLVGFSFEKNVYDGDVDFQEMFQVIKFWHKL
jgi:hypothetical protein